jgi:hypothetical protein
VVGLRDVKPKARAAAEDKAGSSPSGTASAEGGRGVGVVIAGAKVSTGRTVSSWYTSALEKGAVGGSESVKGGTGPAIETGVSERFEN